MSWLDIVIIALLAFGIWEGVKQGLITQLMGLVALLLGIFVAWKFGDDVGRMFSLEGVSAIIVGFTVVLIAVIVVVKLIGRLVQGLFKLAGLGIFDKLFGVAFSVLKTFIVVGIVLMIAEGVDPKGKVLTDSIKERSPMYKATMAVTGFVFPYVELFKDKIWKAKRSGVNGWDNSI